MDYNKLIYFHIYKTDITFTQIQYQNNDRRKIRLHYRYII